MSALRAAALALLIAACTARSDSIPEQWTNFTLEATPVELGADRVGALMFRGGLALDAPRERGFNSWSDLDVSEDNRIIAVSDDGKWLALNLVLDDAGALIGVAQPRMARMRDENGEPFVWKTHADAEDMAQLPDGRLAVSFEHGRGVRVYDMNRDGPFGAALPGPSVVGVGRLPLNASLEAMAAGADGTLVIGAEDAGLLWCARLDQREAPEPMARYALQTGFALVGLDRLPDGDFVALERFYVPVVGASIRVTRIDAAALARGELRVTPLALMPPSLRLDNFEGISAVRMPDGRTRLYLISDDNRGRGRTLLYAFDVSEGG